MNKENLNTLIQRYEEKFYDLINNKENEEIFKWHAVGCFQAAWFSPSAATQSFLERFRAATKECAVLLDNSQVSPTHGIIKMAEQEPEEVERLFVDILFADDDGDLSIRQDHIEEFLEGIEAVRQRHFPSFWKFRQDRHCAFTYLALYAPAENYIYKYSEANEFAKYIEYGVDIGSGLNFKLDAYYGMCDLVVEALREYPTLLRKNESLCETNGYYDESLHLLAFDIIYCSRAYNLYHGMSHAPKARSKKVYTEEELRQKEEAETLTKLAEINAQIQALNVELDQYREISLLNVQVTHKQYGIGTIISQQDNTIRVMFSDGLEKGFIIHAKFPARPTFEDDAQVVAAFTEFDRIVKEIQLLENRAENIARGKK